MKEYVKWKEELSVNNMVIDSQHKELFRLINIFYNSIGSQSPKDAMLQVIEDMENYTVVHFNIEEMMMEKSNYAGLDAHRLEHHKFIEKVSDLKNRYSEGKLILSLEVGSFIREWITNHIKVTDQKYKGLI